MSSERGWEVWSVFQVVRHSLFIANCSFQADNCNNIFGRVQYLQATIMKLASWTLVYCNIMCRNTGFSLKCQDKKIQTFSGPVTAEYQDHSYHFRLQTIMLKSIWDTITDFSRLLRDQQTTSSLLQAYNFILHFQDLSGPVETPKTRLCWPSYPRMQHSPFCCDSLQLFIYINL